MRMREFRVHGFRCVRETGPVKVGDIAVLIGKNENGKTALLEALLHLNKDKPFNSLDYCDEMHEELNEASVIVEGTFELSAAELNAIRKELPGCEASQIKIGRKYESDRVYYDLPGARLPVQFEIDKEARTRLDASVQTFRAAALLDPLIEPSRARLDAAMAALTQIDGISAETLSERIANLEQLVPAETPTRLLLEHVRESSKGVVNPVDVAARLRGYIYKSFHPRFVYFSEYKKIHGAVHLPTYISGNDASAKKQLDTGELLDRRETVANLLYLADLDPAYLEKIKNSPAQRNKYLRECSSRLTAALEKTWKTQRVEVELEYGIGDILVIKVCDIQPDGSRTNLGLLSRRSEGFRWHFSFYVNFTAEIQRDDLKEAILLLDEPALHLHPAQQAGMLEVLAQLARTNQIVYTTHSPYLIYKEDLGSILTVELDPVSHLSKITPVLWKGDPETIAPVLQVLGAPVFAGLTETGLARYAPPVLIVEGLTDLMYLLVMEEVIGRRRKGGLSPRIWFVPAAGSAAVGTLALFYQSRGFKTFTLFDDEPAARQHAEALNYQGFPEGHIMVCSLEQRPESDIEDFFAEAEYLRAVNEVYRVQLKDSKFSDVAGADLAKFRKAAPPIHRIVDILSRIWEDHSADGWGNFDKRKVCAAVCDLCVRDEKFPTEKTVARFEALLNKIYERVSAGRQETAEGARQAKQDAAG